MHPRHVRTRAPTYMQALWLAGGNVKEWGATEVLDWDSWGQTKVCGCSCGRLSARVYSVRVVCVNG